MKQNRRQVNSMLLLAAIAAAHPKAWALGPSPSLSPPFTISDFDWVDTARGRKVPARLYCPAAAPPGAPMPLVLFSHGIGGSRQGYSYLGKHWSSHGIASLHVQHVGSDSALWRGNPFGVVGRLQAAAQEREAIARAGDVRFALDRWLSGEVGPGPSAVDRSRIVVAGHSYGANTALLTVGARVVRNDAVLSCLDDRVAAAVVISAPPFYGERDLGSVLGAVSVPTLHVTSTDDVIQIPGYVSGAQDRIAIYDAIGDPQKLLAVFQGGSHSIFTDRPITGGVSLNPRVKAATADLAMAFFDLVFSRDNTALKTWQAAWQPILARSPATAFPAPTT